MLPETGVLTRNVRHFPKFPDLRSRTGPDPSTATAAVPANEASW